MSLNARHSEKRAYNPSFLITPQRQPYNNCYN